MSASRVFLQTGLANVRSFTEAFRASYPVGTRVYPDEAIALADFDCDLVDDIILGNRIFLSTQDRDLSSGSPVPAYGDFSHIEGLTVGNRKFKKVWSGNVDGVRPDDLIVKFDDGSVGVYLTTHDASKRVPGGSGVGFRFGGELVPAGSTDVALFPMLMAGERPVRRKSP